MGDALCRLITSDVVIRPSARLHDSIVQWQALEGREEDLFRDMFYLPPKPECINAKGYFTNIMIGIAVGIKPPLSRRKIGYSNRAKVKISKYPFSKENILTHNRSSSILSGTLSRDSSSRFYIFFDGGVMQIGQYQFHILFTTPAVLPEFKGSMLRGGFGRCLKSVCCALRKKDCTDCLLSPTCIYKLIFETTAQPNDNIPARNRVSAPPHPYVLQPPLTTQRTFQVGDCLDFGLILFGAANSFLPHIIYAFERLGETGLREGARTGSAQFTLENIRSGDTVIYDGSRKFMDRNLPLTDIGLKDSSDQPVTNLTVRLLSPLRLKQHNQFQDSLPFHVLVRAALRRISTLENAHGRGEPDLDYADLVKRAAGIAIKRSECRWRDLTRYSSRQNTIMLLGGLQGTITYEGDLTEYLPLLQYCEKAHLGKQTAFGLGRVEISVE